MNMSLTQQTRLPVLIIGSGLGGLTLAQSLQKHQIPYKIFERDSASSHRAQGYRIGVDENGASGIKTALPEELFDKFERTCGESHPPGGRVDAVAGRLVMRGIPGMILTGGVGMVGALAGRALGKKWGKWRASSWEDWYGPWMYQSGTYPSPPTLPKKAGTHYQVDRRVLRSILLESLSNKIAFDSAFTSYTASPDCITAHFADGTSIRGSLLVGADGVRSLVASQLLGSSSAPRDLGRRIIYGKTPLTPRVDNALLGALAKGTSFVTDTSRPGKRVLMVVECMRFHDSQCPPDYIFWALCAQTGSFSDVLTDEQLLKLSGKGAVDLLIKMTENWDPSVRVILEEQDENETAVLRMSSSDPEGPPVWKTDRRVTVLGDAIHCMPPTGGQGANSALWDAAMLGEILAERGSEEGEEGGWKEEAVRKYEDSMRWNIGDVVGMACIGASKIV